jgi:hypothetical protein
LIANIFHGCSHPILRYLEIQDVAHLGGRDLGIQKAARFVMYNIRKGEKKTPQHSPVARTRVFYMCVGVHPRQPFFPASATSGAPEKHLLAYYCRRWCCLVVLQKFTPWPGQRAETHNCSSYSAHSKCAKISKHGMLN